MKILLAYDGLAYTHDALAQAAELAEKERAAVTVLSVVQPDARATKSGGHMGLLPHADDAVARARTFLEERGVEVETKVEHGKPAETILGEAGAGGYDLIVLGTRGLGPIGTVLLGSVGRKVTKHAPCPVLVVGQGESRRFEPAVVTR